MTIIDLVSQQQRTSLVEQLTDGTPFVLTFGGQGAEPRLRIAQLRGTYGRDIGADELWNGALDLLEPVLAEVTPWWPDDPRSPDWHPRIGSGEAAPVTAGPGRWSDAAASVPNIAYAQLLETRALRINRLDIGEHPPTAVLGHSQGVLAALAAAGLGDDVTALALAHLIGAAASRVARHTGLVATPSGTPMRAVGNITRTALAAALAEFAATSGDDPADQVVLGVTNAADRHVVVGRPDLLDRFETFADRFTKLAAGSARNGSTPMPKWDPLPVVVGFHHPALAAAADLAVGWAQRCSLDLDGSLRSRVANALPVRPSVEDVVRLVVTEPFDWPTAVDRALDTAPTWIVDLGPDDTAGRLTSTATRGRGIGICSPVPRDGVSQLITPGAAPVVEAPYDSYLPGLLELDDGSVVIDTRLTRLTGHSPFILAGMTPTTVDAAIVAAAANAGIWAELAGGGQVTAPILRERLVELGELLDDGVAVHFNTLHLDPYLWGLHLGPNGALLDELRRGAHVRGVTVSAGIPPLDDAVALIETLTDLAVETVTFKPGTIDGIRQVVAIADAVAPRHVFAHIEGGRAGGHHSWEDLDDLLLATYGDMRRCPNLVVCVGGGIGTPALAAAYLDGSWAVGHGRPAMPVDGILIGTAAMACAEATTSPQVKRLLAECRGTDAWIAAGSSDAGVASGRSQLGADIHELDNSASRAGRLLDEVAGDSQAVDRRRDEIIDALDRTAKPYFGDVAVMTYDAVLGRYADLCAIGRDGRYEDGRWLDVSWRDRFIDLAQRAEARLDQQDQGPIPTRFADRATVDDPDAALSMLRTDLPAITTTVLHPADVSYFVDVCRKVGKPVPFVPVVDEEVRRWWRSDSLWQAHDDRYDADGVVVIPGPVAVSGIDLVDEPVAALFARFESEVVAALADRDVPAARRTAARRRDARNDGPVGIVLSEPTVTWAGRRRRNPALAIAPADEWSVDDAGTGHAPGGRARLVPHTGTGTGTDTGTVTLEVDLAEPGRRSTTIGVDLRLVDRGGFGVVVSEHAADSWSAALLAIAAGSPSTDRRLDPLAARDHAALFGAREMLPDGLVGSIWSAVFAAIGTNADESPVDGGFMDLVHLDHRVELLRPPTVGSRLAIAVAVTDVRDTTMGRVIAVTATIDEDGHRLATLDERFLVRGVTGTERLDVLGAPGAADGIVATERRTLATTTATAPSSAAPMATFTGDHNPLHSSVEIARIAGFADPIVHGMWISAAMQQAARTSTGPTLPLRSWQVQFLAPVGYRDEVRITVVRIGQAAGDTVVEITARCGDVLVAQAHALVAAPRTVYAFPGQGIQRVGMGLDGLGRSAAARSVWERADRHTRKRLGFSILHVVRDNPTEVTVGTQRFRHPEGVLHLTQFTQVAMATLASAQVAELRESGGLVADAICCGHSVGEYNALAAITGILELEAVVELVYHRGLAMHRLVPRDADGASRYQMAAARPSEAGLDEQGLIDLVDRIAADLGSDTDRDAEFLQVVNFNLRGRQYAIAGTVNALRRLEDELETLRRRRRGKGVFIRVPGIDVPFHSAVLHDGVPDFRDRLDSILPAHIDPALLVGRYVPNLVPRLFNLDREFVVEITETVPSAALADVLDDWDSWTTRPAELCRVMLLELLAWQFASPVRWIETQDLLFAAPADGGVGTQRFIEIGLGSQPTISSLARQTLQLDDAPFARPTVLNIDVDRAALFGEDVDPPEDDEIDEAPTPESPVAAPAPGPAAGATTAGTPSTVADLTWSAHDGLRGMLSWWTKIRPDQLGAADSIEGLCDGASSRRNQLLMDLGAEFGLGAIEGAAEAELAKLTDEVGTRARTYRALGPVLRVAVDEQLRRVTGPAKGRPTTIAERVQGHWGLGAGWAIRVTAHVAAGTRTGTSVRGGDLAWLAPATPTSPAELDALVDAAVADLAGRLGIVVAPPKAESSGTLDASAAAALLDTIVGADGVLTDMAGVLNRHLGLGANEPDPDPRLDDALRTSAVVDRELGADWPDRVAAQFDAAATLVIDDRWAGQREDLARLAATSPTDTAARDELQERLRGGLADAAARHAAWWRGHADDDLDLIARLDGLLLDDRIPVHADDVALVTGASPGSIATEVVARLLSEGCTVIATSSRLDDERIAAFRELYHRHATVGAALWLAPANLASNSDVDDLVAWITEPHTVGAGGASRLLKPAMTPTLLFPFAAPPVSGDLGDVGPRAEIEVRVLLWSVERTIARLAAARVATGRSGHLHVVLPGSPNRGLFGGDGAYGEAKSAFDALARRSTAEPSWGHVVGIVHAVIGWVRGTGLMAANDRLADAVEATGISTWTAGAMADRLVGLCSDRVRSAAAEAPVDIDLSGGLLGATIDLRALAASVQDDDAPTSDDEIEADTIDALPSPTRPTPASTEPWADLDVDLADTVVIVGLGEVGPLGSTRTRFEIEVNGRLSPGGVAELAWLCGLIRWEQQPRPGFYDTESGDLVAEHDLVERYHDRLMAHSGIRLLEDDGRMMGGKVPLLASVFLDRDLGFTVDTAAEAEAFVASDPERTSAVESPDGSWLVTRRAGTEIRVPRTVDLPRGVGAQLPAGFDPTVFGIPADMVEAIDRVAIWNLVATVDAFVDAGIEPAELLQWVHPSEVANTQGTGIGGISAIRSMYVDSLLGEPRANDILQEALPNVVAAHVMQSYVGGYGSMIHPVAACATAAVSVEEAFDKIRSGRAAIVVAGGFDDYGPEGLMGFAAMSATASSDDLATAGVDPRRMSRPNDRRRAGFVEGQGGGTIVLARGDIALELGLPVHGVVAWAGSFSDGINTSIPAPGLGLVAAGRGGPASALARRLRALGVGPDDVDVVSKHDTSTLANDPNESLVHEQIAAALGRSDGNPMLVVSQKSVTGHAKGGAAAFQIAGLCQVLSQGIVPPNRSIDCIDPALEEHQHLVWPTRPVRPHRLRAGLVTSLGFGHVAAIVAVVHPAAFVAAIDPALRADYVERSARRSDAGHRRRLAAAVGGPPLYRRPDRRLGNDHDDERRLELTMLADASARLAADGVIRVGGAS